MALTADREYRCQNPSEFLEILAGGADTLFKGAIVSIAAADGYIKVPDATAADVPIGLMRNQEIVAGGHAEKCVIDTGRLSVMKKAQQTTTVAPGTGGVDNVNYKETYFQIYAEDAPFCCWFDVNSTDTDPTIEAPELGESVEIDIGTADNAATVGGKIAAVINALDEFSATGTTTVTIVAVNRGANTASVNSGTAPVTLLNTVQGTAIQDDVGLLWYAIEDDGVVPTAQKSTATVAFGRCVGLIGLNNELMIDTRDRK